MIAKGTRDELAVAIGELASGHPKRKFVLLAGVDGDSLYVAWGSHDYMVAMGQIDAFVAPFWTGTYLDLMQGTGGTAAEAILKRMVEAGVNGVKEN
jgi:hypothetical protein